MCKRCVKRVTRFNIEFVARIEVEADRFEDLVDPKERTPYADRANRPADRVAVIRARLRDRSLLPLCQQIAQLGFTGLEDGIVRFRLGGVARRLPARRNRLGARRNGHTWKRCSTAAGCGGRGGRCDLPDEISSAGEGGCDSWVAAR